jgi:hypothetical protein
MAPVLQQEVRAAVQLLQPAKNRLEPVQKLHFEGDGLQPVRSESILILMYGLKPVPFTQNRVIGQVLTKLL